MVGAGPELGAGFGLYRLNAAGSAFDAVGRAEEDGYGHFQAGAGHGRGAREPAPAWNWWTRNQAPGDQYGPWAPIRW
ncbi:hypothetical protein EV645_6151 [Kribbella rubisoli]|uniref:Uncharacterized protein n=1 Tax=Kribbella rubisoli TaxID=3075929 RepID=A0A4Q7WLM9_9ACTN|nr:hypothetical protein EV645_6151 [Kribbella rubisoli]